MTETEHLAAEHALGLLTGADLLAARGRVSADPAFAAEVDAWDARLAPLLDEIAPVSPGADLWSRIDTALGQTGGEVVALRRSLRVWRAASAVAAAAAAVLAIVALPREGAPVSQPQVAAEPAAQLIAALDFPGARTPVAVAYAPDRRELTVAAAGHVAAGGHDDELWIIPAGGTPRSLGVLHADTTRVPISPELAALFAAGATVAVTQEAPGGSPTGAPKGPIIAKGGLASA